MSSSTNLSANLSIVGRWQPLGTNEVVSFYANGDVSYGGLKGTYQYDGNRLIMNFKRGEKYRSVTTVGACLDGDRLYLSYTGKGYLTGSKNNNGIRGKWESYRYFKLINNHTGYPYNERFERLVLDFWKDTVQIVQGYDTHEDIITEYSYNVVYDDVVDRYYFCRKEYPQDRTYYEITEMSDRKLLLLSHEYELSGSDTVSVTFNYPIYERLP